MDTGGPLGEFLHLLLTSVAQNNILFCGSMISRTRNYNVVELNRKTFYYVGVFIALYILHGGPAPKLFSSAIADNNYCLWHTEGQSRNH